jgi:TonB family protein
MASLALHAAWTIGWRDSPAPSALPGTPAPSVLRLSLSPSPAPSRPRAPAAPERREAPLPAARPHETADARVDKARAPTPAIPLPAPERAPAAAPPVAAAPALATPASAAAAELAEADRAERARLEESEAADRLAAYVALIRTRVESEKRYPSAARRRAIEGVVVARLDISADGSLASMRVDEQAPSLLGRATRQAIELAAPFPVPPSGALSLELPIRYQLDR